MTTQEDTLYDALYTAAAAYCISKGIRTGVERIAQVMLEAAEGEATEIQAELARQTEMAV